ncbi:hypothetical protein [Streptomyces millisiae]|uniref:YokE-like PH domain-containing protein n=1 Tax=Streptomyces millisiae TaxID=3075542 RepID=A0ABU2LRA2_9ACTN|nr:hypothetical protein [Streptomyces sp. DSM 44918]MDT0320126.1 hypothetical protein [Streptomyces sp. DSM 44918]
MAILKATMRQQVAEAIARVNPADRPLVTVHGVTGPSPYLMSGLGLIGQLFIDYYFVTITERAVVFHRASRASNRPKELAFVVDRAEAARRVSDGQRGSLWSSFRFHLPGKEKPTRINVGRQWRAELDQFMPLLLGGPMTAPPPAPPAAGPYPPGPYPAAPPGGQPGPYPR